MKKTTLFLLTETERAMVQESVEHFNENLFLGSGSWVSIQAREKCRAISVKNFKIIQQFDGGVRKIIPEAGLQLICDALRWYGRFFCIASNVVSNKKLDPYTGLSYILEGRNKYIEMFDFDPNNYNPKEQDKILLKDFSIPRFLIIREGKLGIDFVSEFHMHPNESLKNYKERANQKLEEKLQFQKLNPTGKWLLIEEKEINKFKVSSKCSYFS